MEDQATALVSDLPRPVRRGLAAQQGPEWRPVRLRAAAARSPAERALRDLAGGLHSSVSLSESRTRERPVERVACRTEFRPRYRWAHSRRRRTGATRRAAEGCGPDRTARLHLRLLPR